MVEIKTKKFTVEELMAEKKAKAQKRAEELRSLMDVSPEEWVKDVYETRHGCDKKQNRPETRVSK